MHAIGDSEFNQRTLNFYVNAPQRGEIKVSYMVPYAHWQPIYKAELNTVSKQITLTRMATITQKTGEDWSNIKLTLSTTTPQNNIQYVEPKSWWVNYSEPEPDNKYVGTSNLTTLAEVDSNNKNTTQSQAPQFPQFQSNNLNFSTEFRSQKKTSIPSSQQQIFLPLSTEQYPAKLSIWAIPKQSNQAIINAEIAKLDQNWPSGIVRVYRDGDFVGQRLWQNKVNNTLQLSFGVDDQIQIQVIDLVDKKSLVKEKQSESIQKQKYTIQNLHSYPIHMTIFESEPQSRNGQLTVHSIYSQPPTAITWNGQPNINSWQIQLNAKQTYQLDVQHQFKYPNKGKTTGF